MFTAYLDASGSLNQPVICVAGYVATVKAWETFDTDWRIALAHDNVPYFHMKEFIACRGAFKDWTPDQVSRRANFLARLVDIIRVACRNGFQTLTAIRKCDFDEINQGYLVRETFGNPYAFCALSCAVKTRFWKTELKIQEPIEYIFEHGDTGWMALKRAFDKFDLPIPIQKRKRNKNNPDGPTPLEAADFAAWEMHKVIATVEQKTVRSVNELRRSFHALHQIRGDKVWGVTTKSKFIKLCEDLGISKRP